jgi:hypothetical protein
MEDLTLTFPYTATDLTDQINVIPNRYGLMQELDLFPTEGSISNHCRDALREQDAAGAAGAGA